MEASRLGAILSREKGNVWVKVMGDRAVLYIDESPFATLSSKNLSEGVLSAGNLTLNTNTRQVYCNSQFISMTRTEFDILSLLVRSQDRVTTYASLMKIIDTSRHALYQHIYAIRKLLRKAGWNGRITTIRGVGFRIIT